MIKAIVLSSLSVLVLAGPSAARVLDQGPGAEVSSVKVLSDKQKESIKQIHIDSEKKAAGVALRLAGIVRRIYENMLAQKPNEKLRVKLSADMKETAWELLAIKGQSIRDVVYLLTPEQKELIKKEMTKEGAPGDLFEVISKTFGLEAK